MMDAGKTPEEVMQIIESIDDVPSMVAHVMDVALASAMARYGDLDARQILRHLVPIAESDPSGFEGRAGQMCLDLLDLIADEIRNSSRPEDEEMVRRVEALQQRTKPPKPEPVTPTPKSQPEQEPLDIDFFPEELRQVLRQVLDEVMNPIERQLSLALLATRVRENGHAIGYPIMMLSSPGVGKTTYWSTMESFTDALADSGEETPFRVHVVDATAGVFNVAELLGAPTPSETGGIGFKFYDELNDKIKYCKEHDVPIVLVFDEATKNPRILQTMLPLVNLGVVGGRKLDVLFRIVLLGDRDDWEGQLPQLGSIFTLFADRFLYHVTTPDEERKYFGEAASRIGIGYSDEDEKRSDELLAKLARLSREADEIEEETFFRTEGKEFHRGVVGGRGAFAGLIGELDRLREMIRSGESPEIGAGIGHFLISAALPYARTILRAIISDTAYRLLVSLANAMLEGALAHLFERFRSDPKYRPNYADIHSDQKHMSPLRAEMIADQLAMMLGLGYDLDSEVVHRFLASNIGTPHIPTALAIVRDALKPHGADTIAGVLDKVALEESYHMSTVLPKARVTPQEGDKSIITLSQLMKAEANVTAEQTVPLFEGKAIHTIDDLIDALAENDVPPGEREDFKFSPLLCYADLRPDAIVEAGDEIYFPGFDPHASAVLTKSRHLLQLADSGDDPIGYAQNLSDVDPNSPLGLGVRAVLKSADVEAVSQRLQELKEEISQGANCLRSMLSMLSDDTQDVDQVVDTIYRDAHRVTGAMAIMSMFDVPIYDSETQTRLTPEQIGDDDQKKFYQDSLVARRNTLAKLAGLKPEQVDAIVDDPMFTPQIFFASGQGELKQLVDKHWQKVNDRWGSMSTATRKKLLQAMQLLSAWSEPTIEPYGVFTPAAQGGVVLPMRVWWRSILFSDPSRGGRLHPEERTVHRGGTPPFRQRYWVAAEQEPPTARVPTTDAESERRAKETVGHAFSALAQMFPELSGLLPFRKIVYTNEVATMAVDPFGHLYISPRFVTQELPQIMRERYQKRTGEEPSEGALRRAVNDMVRLILMHESLHLVLTHFPRQAEFLKRNSAIRQELESAGIPPNRVLNAVGDLEINTLLESLIQPMRNRGAVSHDTHFEGFITSLPKSHPTLPFESNYEPYARHLLSEERKKPKRNQGKKSPGEEPSGQNGGNEGEGSSGQNGENEGEGSKRQAGGQRMRGGGRGDIDQWVPDDLLDENDPLVKRTVKERARKEGLSEEEYKKRERRHVEGRAPQVMDDVDRATSGGSGTSPASRLLRSIRSRKRVDWRQELNDFLLESKQFSAQFQPHWTAGRTIPVQYADRRILYPRAKPRGTMQILVLLDASGSISNKAMSQFLGHMEDLAMSMSSDMKIIFDFVPFTTTIMPDYAVSVEGDQLQSSMPKIHEALQVEGGTDVVQSIMQALEQFEGHSGILVLTNGLTDWPEGWYDRYLQESQGVPLRIGITESTFDRVVADSSPLRRVAFPLPLEGSEFG